MGQLSLDSSQLTSKVNSEQPFGTPTVLDMTSVGLGGGQRREG